MHVPPVQQQEAPWVQPTLNMPSPGIVPVGQFVPTNPNYQPGNVVAMNQNAWQQQPVQYMAYDPMQQPPQSMYTPMQQQLYMQQQQQQYMGPPQYQNGEGNWTQVPVQSQQEMHQYDRVQLQTEDKATKPAE
jgi:hypothetical protein